MKTLIVETSCEKGLIALFSEKKLLDGSFLEGGPSLSKNLALETHILLKKHLFQPDRIAVGTGPGSYTGIRAGVSFAKGLALGLQIPLAGFVSLKAFVKGEVSGLFAILLDAKSGGVYCLLGEGQNQTQSFQKPIKLSIERARQELREVKHLFTPSLGLLPEKLSLEGEWEETAPNPHLILNLLQQEPEQNPTRDISLHYLSLI